MIAQVFPKDFERYLSLAVLGPLMDRYAAWPHDQQYTWRSSRFELLMAAHVCRYLRRRAVERIEDINAQHLQAAHSLFKRKFPRESGSVLVLARFLFEHGCVQPPMASKPKAAEIHLNAFESHLRDARGYAASTIQRDIRFASEFLQWLHFEKAPRRLSSLSTEEIEGFIRRLSKRMGRVALQKPIATLRKFLRFLAAKGVVAPGLDRQIDTPHIYRQEQLPRALPWPTVQAFLRSINRNLAIGKRDYAMFSLMATYGLRACDVVALTLDDLQWRTGLIRIRQSKTGHPLDLPLSDGVGSAIHDYLTKVGRYGSYRNVFLRLKAPGGIKVKGKSYRARKQRPKPSSEDPSQQPPH